MSNNGHMDRTVKAGLDNTDYKSSLERVDHYIMKNVHQYRQPRVIILQM